MKKVIISIFVLTLIVNGHIFSQNVEFERNVELRGTNLTLNDGTLWITDSTAGSAKVNLIFLDDDSLKIFTNLLNKMELDKHANIRLSNSAGEQLVLVNGSTFNTNLSTLGFSDPGAGAGNFILATEEFQSESSGINGNGASLTMWSPGDQIGGVTAHLIILDEDDFGDGDTNPYNNGAIVAYLNTSGIWTVSDRNKKQNIRKYTSALKTVEAMNAYRYEYEIPHNARSKNSEPIASVGLMAQDIAKLVPEAVNKSAYGDHFINYSMITPILVEAIKEQQTTIKNLSERIASLEQK